jgi:uncharacterized protein YbaP (TraB family)
VQKSLLWRVEKDGYYTSLLFGTVHLHDERLNSILESVYPHIDQVDHVMTEIDLDLAKTSEMISYFYLPENTDKKNFIKLSHWNKIVDIASKRTTLDLNSMEHLKPLLILHQVSHDIFGSSVEKSMDEFLWNYALQKGKTTGGLESVAQHFETINHIPLEYQYKVLYKSFRHFDTLLKSHKVLLNAYLNEDLQRIYKISRRMLGKYRRLMLFDRNHTIFQSILIQTKMQSNLFACGAAHLYGNEGILALLKKKKFTIKALKIKT